MADYPIDEPLFDYKVYRFGRSRQIFRGPQQDLRGRYLCFLGASHTFGRFADHPYPAIVGAKLGIKSLNLGTDGAGPGFFLADPDVLRAASDADLCIVQVMCATAISNRMFSVRPRRNARIYAVSELLHSIYPDVDFDRFAFVRPMLRHLHELDATRFRLVENEMQNAWMGRTQGLLNSIETRTILLWFAQRAPEDVVPESDGRTSPYPLFINRAMVDSVRDAADQYVEVVSRRGLPQDLRIDGRAVMHRPSGEPIEQNREFPSPEMHLDAAEALAPAVDRLLRRPDPLGS